MRRALRSGRSCHVISSRINMLARKLLRGKTSATIDHFQNVGLTARSSDATVAASCDLVRRNVMTYVTPTVNASHTTERRLMRKGRGPQGTMLNRCPNIVNNG